MNGPGTWLAASELFLVEHYSERRLLANSTTVALKGGGSNRTAFGTGEYSMLDSDGRLPNNKIGRISGVMVDFDLVASTATNEATKTAAFHLAQNIRQTCRLRLYVGGVQLCEHLVAMLTAPGSFNTVGTGTASTAPMLAGNNGWPVSFGEHPIAERQQITWDIDSLVALDTAPAASTLRMTVTIQVKTQTIIPGASR